MFDSLFSERGLSLDRLRMLVEFHEAGSIARAAPGNLVRQSQFSRQIRELSSFFGCELAQKQGKKLFLTKEGEELAIIVRNHFQSLVDFHSNCRSEQNVFSIAAGDSLVQWLLIPRLGKLMSELQTVRFSTLSLQTNEIARQLSDSRVDFGLIRKTAQSSTLKSHSLGHLTYVAIVPKKMITGRVPSLAEVIKTLPLAMTTSNGEFTAGMKLIADGFKLTHKPALSCQSFPQAIAAVRSGEFAAIVPKIAVSELNKDCVRIISDPALKRLDREIVLAWNPRSLKVRPQATKVLEAVQAALKLS